MKKFLLVIGVALGSMATAACSQQTAPVSAGRVITKDAGLSPVYASGKCRFKTKLVAGQTYSHAAGDSYMFDDAKPVSWGFPIHCHIGAAQKYVYGTIGAKPVDGKWVWFDDGTPFEPKEHFKLIQFSGKNWKGIATAVDQIYYAPADQRSRFFNFCLVEDHGPQVLCGRTQIRGVTQPESESRLPKILAVLKTIVFVNIATSDANQSKPASTSGH